MKILGPVSASPMIVKTPHVHGADCKHDHDGHDHGEHDHHGHDHHDHDHHSQEEHEAALKPTDDRAEDGGDAAQFSLSHMLPGETDDLGRFEKMRSGHAGQRRHPYGASEKKRRRGASVCPLRPGQADSRGSDDPRHRGLAPHEQALRASHWFVRGMEAAQCADVIEYALRKTNGVLSANVAYAAERLKLEWD